MQERLKLSIPSVKRLTAFLRAKGFVTSSTGQESWLSPELHQQIRHIYNNKTIDLIRYFPDLVVYRNDIGCFLIEAKSTTPEHYDTQNFSIETACLKVDKRLSQIGIRVLIIFENRPSEYYGAWANEIEPILETTETTGFQGSKTPMSLVVKASVLELNSKLRSIINFRGSNIRNNL